MEQDLRNAEQLKQILERLMVDNDGDLGEVACELQPLLNRIADLSKVRRFAHPQAVVEEAQSEQHRVIVLGEL